MLTLHVKFNSFPSSFHFLGERVRAAVAYNPLAALDDSDGPTGDNSGDEDSDGNKKKAAPKGGLYVFTFLVL